MTDDEIRALVAHANSTYGKAPLPNEASQMRHSWKRFLHDLDGAVVRETFDALALTETYMPRPGELRVKVLLGDLPSGLEAWAALQRAREGIASGGEYPAMDPFVAEFVRSLGDTAMGLHTNGDRSMFLAAYERYTAKHLQSRCRVTGL